MKVRTRRALSDPDAHADPLQSVGMSKLFHPRLDHKVPLVGGGWLAVIEDMFQELRISGMRGSGKSDLLELILFVYWRLGWTVLDLFHAEGAREALYWAIPREKAVGAITDYAAKYDWDPAVPIPVLFIGPPDLKIAAKGPSDIETVPYTASMPEIIAKAREADPSRVVVYAHSLIDEDCEKEHGLSRFEALAEWIKQLNQIPDEEKGRVAIGLRETANFAYSRGRPVVEIPGVLKRRMINLCQQARSGYHVSLVWDTQREQDVDASVRQQPNKVLIKKMPEAMLCDEMKWFPRALDEWRASAPFHQRLWFKQLGRLFPDEAYFVDWVHQRFTKLFLPESPFLHCRETFQFSRYFSVPQRPITIVHHAVTPVRREVDAELMEKDPELAIAQGFDLSKSIFWMRMNDPKQLARLKEAVVDLVMRHGYSHSRAGRVIGVTPTTVGKWLGQAQRVHLSSTIQPYERHHSE